MMVSQIALTISILPSAYSICCLDSVTELSWSMASQFISITRSEHELSVVCETSQAPLDARKITSDWKVMRVNGPLDHGLVGVLAAISKALADGRVSLFAISTFETDYVLVKATDLDRARTLLESGGFHFAAEGPTSSHMLRSKDC